MGVFDPPSIDKHKHGDSGFKIDLKAPKSLEALMGGVRGENNELERITGKPVFMFDKDLFAPIVDVLSTNPYSFNAGNPAYINLMEENPGLEKALERSGSMPSAYLQNIVVRLHDRLVESLSPAAAIPFDDFIVVYWDDESVIDPKNFAETVKFNGPFYPEFSGTVDELRALTILHELEHGIVEQIAIFKQDPNMKGLLPIEHQQGSEIEADISALKNAVDIVSPETMQWWVDMRFAFSAYSRFNNLIFDVPDINKVHDVAPFAKEYQCTGEIPTYKDMADAVDRFYEKAVEQFNIKYAAAGFEQSLPYPVFVATIKDEVRAGLLSEPCLFEGEEISIAQNFIDSMDNLGLQYSKFEYYIEALQDNGLLPVQKSPHDPVQGVTPDITPEH